PACALKTEPHLKNQPRLENQARLENRPRLKNRPHLKNQPRLENQARLENRPRLKNQPRLENRPRLKNQPRLENRPCLENRPHLENRPTLEELESVGLVRLYPRHRAGRGHIKRRRRRGDRSPSRLRLCRRSHREERSALHAVWRSGVDDQEIGHLKRSYESMKLLRLGCDWLSSVTWVPHPATDIALGKSRMWETAMRHHLTGSARSEGYYVISSGDKQRYLTSTHSDSARPPEDTQPQLSLRSASDLRADQRRLLSSFSCDSDLLKFNQLKVCYMDYGITGIFLGIFIASES
ncbi:histone-lysine N-methyltransferase SETD1B-A-like, partial [Alosa alosa]|uniref:histone-lysine N-methyltransferase SETD1B-A-like n=1 Tax=Alosa alosa TaxID=278164 RepID=UPI0020150DC8